MQNKILSKAFLLILLIAQWATAASTYSIYLDPADTTALPGSTVSFDVKLGIDPVAPLELLSYTMRLHSDSPKMTFNNATDVLNNGFFLTQHPDTQTVDVGNIGFSSAIINHGDTLFTISFDIAPSAIPPSDTEIGEIFHLELFVNNPALVIGPQNGDGTWPTAPASSLQGATISIVPLPAALPIGMMMFGFIAIRRRKHRA